MNISMKHNARCKHLQNLYGSKVWGRIKNALLVITQLYSFPFRQNTLITVIEQDTLMREGYETKWVGLISTSTITYKKQQFR